MYRMQSATAVIAALVLGLTTLGCEGDEFEDAPSAQAGASEGGSQPGCLGPVEGDELPPGHPPLAPGQQGGAAQGGSAAQGGQMAPAASGQAVNPDDYGRAGPIRWDAPEGWEPQQPSSSMRFAQYGVGDGAELSVFYFGPDQGGGAQSNLDRWEGQLSGGPAAKRSVEEVAGMTVHRFDGEGTYNSNMPAVSDGPQENQRLLGAIAETSQGLFFFRLLGDKAVVDEEAAAFDEFVASFRDGQ